MVSAEMLFERLGSVCGWNGHFDVSLIRPQLSPSPALGKYYVFLAIGSVGRPDRFPVYLIHLFQRRPFPLILAHLSSVRGLLACHG